MSILLEDLKPNENSLYPLVHNVCYPCQEAIENESYLTQISVRKFKVPQYPLYADERDRKKTFKSFNWPYVRLANLSTKHLAAAGFFYEGKSILFYS